MNIEYNKKWTIVDVIKGQTLYVLLGALILGEMLYIPIAVLCSLTIGADNPYSMAVYISLKHIFGFLLTSIILAIYLSFITPKIEKTDNDYDIYKKYRAIEHAKSFKWLHIYTFIILFGFVLPFFMNLKINSIFKVILGIGFFILVFFAGFITKKMIILTKTNHILLEDIYDGIYDNKLSLKNTDTIIHYLEGGVCTTIFGGKVVMVIVRILKILSIPFVAAFLLGIGIVESVEAEYHRSQEREKIVSIIADGVRRGMNK